MGFLRRITGGKKEAETEAPSRQDTPESACGHGMLIPRWDRAEDMGHEDRATSYTCESCSASLTPQEAQGVMATERGRLRV